MRTLVLAAAAAAACLGDYTPYPYPAGSWKNVKCTSCGMDIECPKCYRVECDIDQRLTVSEGFTIIFVISQSASGTSNDAFLIQGNVNTDDWQKTKVGGVQRHVTEYVTEYDATGLNLMGNCKGRRHLTEKDTDCRAECPGELGDELGDEPVTLVKYVVQGHFTQRAIVDCDADKKNLLGGLRPDAGVERFFDSLAPSTLAQAHLRRGKASNGLVG